MLVLVLLAPAFATAGEEAVDAAFFARLDTNGDSAITGEEYRGVGEAEAFEQMDRDKDNRISLAELRGWIRLTPPRPADVVPALGGGPADVVPALGGGPADVVPALGGGPAVDAAASGGPDPGLVPSKPPPPPSPAQARRAVAEPGLFAAVRARVGEQLLPVVLLVSALLGVLLAEVVRASGRRLRRGSRGSRR